MSHSSLPRRSAGPALMLACIMLTAPVLAQETAAPAAGTAPTEAAGAGVPAPAPAVPAPAAPGPEAAATTQDPAPVAAAPQTPAPAASAANDPAASPGNAVPVETVPSPQPAPVAEPKPAAEPARDSILPQVIQDALAPLAPQERDPNLPHDLSPIGMFWAADIVVKAVMLGLLFASVVTWTVLVAKLLELAGATKRVKSGIHRAESATSLAAALNSAGNRRDPVSRMFRAAASEYNRSLPALAVAGDSGVKERVDSHLDRIEAVASRRIGRGTGVLATIGSTAPFVGLFGTVWGIMNAFIGISQSQTTNLAVVAPGIAEALLATAIGLVAAIPAVVIYNVFARAITGYRLQLANASAGVRRLVSRDLDFRDLGTTSRREA
ncbi:tonB-system energizer ExbB [Paracoccus limosus]|uniref:Biopolymer transport protein ExbB n=1 Tax=Paracoccus limosus TaxID=913252 RepID=A0A844H7X1_9RHOB|nr:tonB-system energizer ExbB [Paracoccus limosus]MTH35864.1 tonB-system energizer ExbB [Paracoccus limosus]